MGHTVLQASLDSRREMKRYGAGGCPWFEVMACCDCRKEIMFSLNDLSGETIARVIPTALDTLEKSSVRAVGILLLVNGYAVQ